VQRVPGPLEPGVQIRAGVVVDERGLIPVDPPPPALRNGDGGTAGRGRRADRTSE
jgi:hypothetical protein